MPDVLNPNFISRNTPDITLPPVQPNRIAWGVSSEMQHGSIPKIIWIFWDSNTLPFSIQLALETIKKFTQGYEIRLLQEADLEQYQIDIQQLKKNFAVQALSDYIRLRLLEMYGGIWIDASTFLTRHIDEIFDFNDGAEFYGFYSDKLTTNDALPVVESYFLAARPHAKFIADWLHEFEKCLNASDSRTYYHAFLTEKSRAQNVGMDAGYLIVYVSCMYLMYHQNNYKLSLTKAGDMSHFYTYAFHDKRMNIRTTFFMRKRPERLPGLIKITGPWRHAIDAIYKTGFFKKDAMIFSLGAAQQYTNGRTKKILMFLGRKLRLIK